MKKNSGEKLYNIILPLWLLLFWPTYLWLALIPLNYLIDRFVLRWSLGDLEDKGRFCRRHTWKICLAGFLADFVGAALLLGIMLSEDFLLPHIPHDVMYGATFNPFSNVWGFLIVALAVSLSGLIIYALDRGILKAAGLDPERAKRSALRLALITAPYLYFFPSSLLYQNWL